MMTVYVRCALNKQATYSNLKKLLVIAESQFTGGGWTLQSQALVIMTL